MSFIIKNLSVSVKSKQILHSISLNIKKGELHVLMGPNGSGKSTLAQALMGSDKYIIRNQKSIISINGKNMISMSVDNRSKEGLFLAFQNPVALPGISVFELLKTTKEPEKNQKSHNPALTVWEFHEVLVDTAKQLGIPKELLRKSLNETFSGGEKKKLEMLQALILSPQYAILDEIDAGLDADALKIVAKAISQLQKQGTGILLITHSQRIFQYLKPDQVHILVQGSIKETSDKSLISYVEKNGYKKWID